jgi:AcrR family transcriptional regulator
MDFQVSFKVNEKLYLRDPEGSDLAKMIVKSSIDLIYEIGFEQFTFKKLALEIQTTEASVYRYFENKHRLLLYILNWYWCYMEFLVIFRLQNITDSKLKLTTIVNLLSNDLEESSGKFDYNKKFLNQIVISESSKAYLVKDVREINKDEVFKPYKDLCTRIAEIISEYNPNYEYPRSLSSTLIETSHTHQFFSGFLPKLTDKENSKGENNTFLFLRDLVFKLLKN